MQLTKNTSSSRWTYDEHILIDPEYSINRKNISLIESYIRYEKKINYMNINFITNKPVF